ncbi:hypothetical protein [Burkholderia arboris]|uniref:hypothetical protein n=1 Tax=Burkholderia arboris TaxID=488730 RepID=UPI00210CFC63|nr:hypothetical protein [Burkholderia arboris]UTV53239.1 hypothetical protein NLX30_10075 [Burkholderia arboris]
MNKLLSSLVGFALAIAAPAYAQSDLVSGLAGRLASPTYGAALVAYQSSLAGSVARTAQQKFSDHLALTDFGAKCNGSYNDDPAWTAALAALTPGLSLELPAGTCTLAAGHVAPVVSNVGIVGAGSGQTTILYTGTNTTNDLLTVGNGTTSITGWLLKGFTIQSNTKMTAGAALHLKRMQNGNRVEDVNVGAFGSSSNNLYNAVWLDNVNVFKYTDSNISVANEGLMMNGSASSAEGSDVFIDNVAVTFSKIGYHVGGGQGGIYFGKTLAYGNGVNYQLDNALAAQMNREIFFSSQAVSDGSSSYGVWFNDSLTSNAPVVMNGAFGSAGLIGPIAGVPEVYVQKWPNGRISFGPGQLYNATGDGLKVDDASVQIAIDPSRFIFNNTGYGINATTADNQISNLSQFTYANTAGNYSANVQLAPFTLSSNAAFAYGAGNQAGQFWTVGGKNRWALQTDGSAETGSNAGSGLLLSAYSDAGAYLGSWLQVNRATGRITVPGAIAANSGTMPAYQASGATITNAHAVQGYTSLSSGSATITLAGSAAYTNGSSYTCTAADNSAAAAVYVSQSSGTAFTLTGTGSDLVRFHCTGD